MIRCAIWNPAVTLTPPLVMAKLRFPKDAPSATAKDRLAVDVEVTVQAMLEMPSLGVIEICAGGTLDRSKQPLEVTVSVGVKERNTRAGERLIAGACCGPAIANTVDADMV